MVLEGGLEHLVHEVQVAGHRQAVLVALDAADGDALARAAAARSPPRARRRGSSAARCGAWCTRVGQPLLLHLVLGERAGVEPGRGRPRAARRSRAPAPRPRRRARPRSAAASSTVRSTYSITMVRPAARSWTMIQARGCAVGVDGEQLAPRPRRRARRPRTRSAPGRPTPSRCRRAGRRRAARPGPRGRRAPGTRTVHPVGRPVGRGTGAGSSARKLTGPSCTRTGTQPDQRLAVADDVAEHAVDEGGRLVGGEVADQVERLGDGDGVGHVVDVQHLVGGQPQHVAVHRRHPVERPALGVGRDHLVEPGAVLGHAADQLDGVVVDLAVVRLLLERLDRRAVAHLGGVEEVEGPLAGLGAGAHRGPAERVGGHQELTRPR